jgi:hypothetical protein
LCTTSCTGVPVFHKLISIFLILVTVYRSYELIFDFGN